MITTAPHPSPHDIEYTDGPIITPHGGPSVDAIPFETWPSQAEIYEKIDPDWIDNIKNNDSVFDDKLDDYTVKLFDIVQNIYTATSIIFSNKCNDIVTVRYNPIFRQFEMSELFQRWGLNIRDVQDDETLKQHIMCKYINTLGRYGLCVNDNDWSIIRRLFATIMPNPHYPTDVSKRFIWVSHEIYSVLMIVLWKSIGVPSVEVENVHTRMKCIGSFANHHTHLQVELYTAIGIILNHTNRDIIAPVQTFTSIQLHEWQILIMGNMRSLEHGSFTTCNDIVFYNDLELIEWGMMNVSPTYHWLNNLKNLRTNKTKTKNKNKNKKSNYRKNKTHH
jgi:hypothetical protein